MGSIAACPIAPELLSTPGGPHLSLPCCQSWGQSLSPLPTNSGKRAANLYPSVLPQQRCSTTQWVPSAVGDTECRKDGGAMFDHRQGSETVEIASGREPEYIDKVYLWWFVVSVRDHGTLILNSFLNFSIFLIEGQLLYNIVYLKFYFIPHLLSFRSHLFYLNKK